MMPATNAAGAVARRTGIMGRLGNRTRGGIAQIGREYQHQRRNDAEREKCVQRRLDAAQVARRTTRKLPGDGAGRKPAEGRNRARPGSDLEPRPTLRTLDVVRVRRRFRRGNFRLAMRTNSNGQGSPPNANAYNNRIGGPMKRGDKRRKRMAAARLQSPRGRRIANAGDVDATEPLFTLATKPGLPVFRMTRGEI